MVARAGGLLASRRLIDSVVFDLCRGPGTVAQVVCSRSRASLERSSERPKKLLSPYGLCVASAIELLLGCSLFCSSHPFLLVPLLMSFASSASSVPLSLSVTAPCSVTVIDQKNLG
jgi:hypothetical protein